MIRAVVLFAIIIYPFIFSFSDAEEFRDKPESDIIIGRSVERVVIFPDLVAQTVVILAAVFIINDRDTKNRRELVPFCTDKIGHEKACGKDG